MNLPKNLPVVPTYQLVRLTDAFTCVYVSFLLEDFGQVRVNLCVALTPGGVPICPHPGAAGTC
jgi:hypothetical protein